MKLKNYFILSFINTYLVVSQIAFLNSSSNFSYNFILNIVDTTTNSMFQVRDIVELTINEKYIYNNVTPLIVKHRSNQEIDRGTYTIPVKTGY